jgi:alkylation response protein AidB-like acyl-CoA dehydrogenase
MSTIPRRYADDIYDDLWLPEETLEVRARVRNFAEQQVRPVAHELNNTPESLEAFPRKLVTEMAEAGLFRIPFPAEYGGAGLQYPTLATMVMLEEISYLSSGLSASMIDVQLILFGHTLKHASAEIREQLFPAMMAGPTSVSGPCRPRPGASREVTSSPGRNAGSPTVLSLITCSS